jgi:hypothetical protein
MRIYWIDSHVKISCPDRKSPDDTQADVPVLIGLAI